jgi:hypothetical protein
MKPERGPVELCSDAARPQIGFGVSAGNELASSKQPLRDFAGAGRRRSFGNPMKRLGTRQSEKAVRLVEQIAKAMESAI